MKIQAVATLVIAIKHPRSSPASMLGFFITAFAVELSFIPSSATHPQFKVISHYTAACAAVCACICILLMPLRGPALPSIDIAAVGQRPSSDFRSPEDNLRLWQFLTVSWMAPLISIGRNRQIQEDDVWYLGFQFQHQRLHDKFRRLRGSVVSRLLQANGIDIFIIALIAIVQLLCGMLLTHFENIK